VEVRSPGSNYIFIVFLLSANTKAHSELERGVMGWAFWGRWAEMN